jgi:hypothetical protein
MTTQKIKIVTIISVVAALTFSGCTSVTNTTQETTDMSLLNLPVKEYQVGYGDLWVGQNVDKNKVYLHEKQISDYLFAHASSRVVYDIPEGFRSFNAWGVRPKSNKVVAGSWIYIVKMDGDEVFRSGPLSSYDSFELPINVPIPAGTKTIELITDNMTNGYADHSIWAKPVFKR